jgi:hypothetical protein
MNPFHILLSYSFKTYFNIIFISTVGIATGYGLDGRGTNPDRDKTVLS